MRTRRRLIFLAACVGVGVAIGWYWGAPEREQDCDICERVR